MFHHISGSLVTLIDHLNLKSMNLKNSPPGCKWDAGVCLHSGKNLTHWDLVIQERQTATFLIFIMGHFSHSTIRNTI